MGKTLQRIRADLKHGRNIELYAASAVSLTFAIIALVGEALPEGLRWAVLFAGLSLLMFRLTVPARSTAEIESLIGDRSAFDLQPIASRLSQAKEVWVFAPTAINFLSPQHTQILRTGVLARKSGSAKVVVLDPRESVAVSLASQQLDDSLDFPVQRLQQALATILEQLESMTKWSADGIFEYRLLKYNPGFSLIAIDPNHSNGLLIVEIHGFHSEAVTSRMHLRLTRAVSARWYAYWVSQFDAIWREANEPESTTGFDRNELERP